MLVCVVREEERKTHSFGVGTEHWIRERKTWRKLIKGGRMRMDALWRKRKSRYRPFPRKDHLMQVACTANRRRRIPPIMSRRARETQHTPCKPHQSLGRCGAAGMSAVNTCSAQASDPVKV